MQTIVRKSVPVTAHAADGAEQIRRPESAARTALAELGIELSGTPSEAEIYQALIAAGWAAVEEKMMVTGYAAWAAAQDTEDHAFERGVRGRGERRFGIAEDDA